MPSAVRVSAIVPTHNRADLLGETLRSILDQEVAPDEVIVVDDGSDDDTAAVVAAFSHRVHYVWTANGGAPVARNAGASLASGDWLWFCDSDDLWHRSYLMRALELVAARPQLAFIFGNFRLVRDGVWAGTSKFETAPSGFWDSLGGERAGGGCILPEPLYGNLLRFQPVFHSTLLVSRHLFGAIGGYDPRFAGMGSEDFEFVLRCAAHAPAGMIEDALVGIRRHPGNYSASELRNLLGEIAILRHALVHHGAAARTAEATIREQIDLRSYQALELAFSSHNYALVQSLAKSLPPTTGKPRVRLKILLASFPAILRRPAVGMAQMCRDMTAKGTT
jgi:hypothetical protein